MDNKIKPTILVIVGVTGDLAKRKLLPAIAAIRDAGVLPSQFKVIGTSRKALPESDAFESFIMDTEDPEDYLELKTHLESIEQEFAKNTQEPAQKLFYLSVPADAAATLIENFGTSGINAMPNVKLLMEKPFGRDLVSAGKLVSQIQKYFTEEQVYRIDHYLAKEMAQNIVIFRSHNTLFKNTWNKDFIESIDILASEKIGIEGRAGFYEQTGALRDLVQSHLLQLAALTLMDVTPPLPSPKGRVLDIPTQRLQALQQIEIPQDITRDVVRGQYVGYRDEVKNAVKNIDSMTETFVSMKLFYKDPNWAGVPITITTGKALDKKRTEIRIKFKKDNEIVTIAEQASEATNAYERVFIDAMKSDHSLFVTKEEVLATWRILEPIQKVWEAGETELKMYATGSRVEDILK